MVSAMSHGGKIAILGIPNESPGIDWRKVIFKSLTILGVYGREMYDTWYKMTMLLQSGVDISPVITHRFAFDDYEKAFALMKTGNCGKVILS
jgi:threonine 3-dehydrogenase